MGLFFNISESSSLDAILWSSTAREEETIEHKLIIAIATLYDPENAGFDINPSKRSAPWEFVTWEALIIKKERFFFTVGTISPKKFSFL